MPRHTVAVQCLCESQLLGIHFSIFLINAVRKFLRSLFHNSYWSKREIVRIFVRQLGELKISDGDLLRGRFDKSVCAAPYLDAYIEPGISQVGYLQSIRRMSPDCTIQ